MDLTVVDYEGKEIDLIISQAFDQFIFDDDFVKSRAFKQFLWRTNMHSFQLKSQKIKAEQPDVEDSTIEEVVKDELTKDFNDITPEGGRILLKEAGILILLEWDIANAIFFHLVKREGQAKFKIEEDVQTTHRGVKFSEDHKALVLWSLQDKKDT